MLIPRLRVYFLTSPKSRWVGPGEGDLMSKAFVKEMDDEDDRPDETLGIPAGVKNYMTPEGHRRMQDELRQLLRVDRPKVVETGIHAPSDRHRDRASRDRHPDGGVSGKGCHALATGTNRKPPSVVAMTASDRP